MKQVFFMLGLVLVIVAGGGPVVAGGWAVTSLDSMPVPVAGVPIEVGFVIRQHGVTPISPEGEVGVVVISPNGERVFFAAEQRGQVGHHVAEVTFSDPGVSTWSVKQGWFADHDLGSIDVSAPAVVGVVATRYRWPLGLRAGLPVLAFVLAGFAVADLALRRRRSVVV